MKSLNTVKDLQGLKFTRNKYGIQTWVDTVQDAWIVYNHMLPRKTWRPVFMIRGTKGIAYKLDEVEFLDV